MPPAETYASETAGQARPGVLAKVMAGAEESIEWFGELSLFVGGCLLLFGVGLFLIGNSNQLFTKSFNVHADFLKITGIQNGGKVRVAGMDAGTVTRIEVPAQPDGKFHIYLRVIEKLHPMVRQDSVAAIQTDGLLGNKYLQIDARSTTSQLAENGSLIASKRRQTGSARTSTRALMAYSRGKAPSAGCSRIRSCTPA